MNNYYIIALIGVLLVTPIATYMVIDTGKTLSCSTGWLLQDDGKYMCKTSTTIRYSYCSSLKNSSTKMNYYCKEAALKEIPKIESQNINPTYLCKFGKECQRI